MTVSLARNLGVILDSFLSSTLYIESVTRFCLFYFLYYYFFFLNPICLSPLLLHALRSVITILNGCNTFPTTLSSSCLTPHSCQTSTMHICHISLLLYLGGEWGWCVLDAGHDSISPLQPFSPLITANIPVKWSRAGPWGGAPNVKGSSEWDEFPISPHLFMFWL